MKRACFSNYYLVEYDILWKLSLLIFQYWMLDFEKSDVSFKMHVYSLLIIVAQWKSDYKNKPMDTIFIREVKEGSPAHNAGLTKGDRILAINNYPLTGKSYSDIIHLILRR